MEVSAVLVVVTGEYQIRAPVTLVLCCCYYHLVAAQLLPLLLSFYCVVDEFLF